MNLKIEEIVVELRHESIMLRGYEGYVCWTAADLIEQLQQELIDERYRHDRLQDFCVAQGGGAVEAEGAAEVDSGDGAVAGG
jgi:hypothetical protein